MLSAVGIYAAHLKGKLDSSLLKFVASGLGRALEGFERTRNGRDNQALDFELVLGVRGVKQLFGGGDEYGEKEK